MRRIGVLVLVVFVLILVPFFVWGDARILSGDWLDARLREAGPWLPVAGVGLLVADLALPVPATVVMTVLGRTCGWAAGTLWSLAGMVLAAAVGYGLARALGRPGVRWLVSEQELGLLERGFERHGLALVVVSRTLPVLPEAASVLAGLARMPAGRFGLAVLLGSLPTAAVYSALGAWWGTAARQGGEGGLPLAISLGLPVLLAVGFELWRRPAFRG